MPGVRIITDSTSSLPERLAYGADIRVVPVQVIIDGAAYAEGSDITPPEVAARLRAGASVSTSRPSPQAFLEAYRKAADEGADEVVSVHLSAALSGTVEAARIASADSPVPVHVVDTETVAMAAGFAALDAAGAARAGGSGRECAEAAKATAAGSSLFFYVDTLEYLARGGRIGTAQRYVGQALRVKPLLHMSEGSVAALEKVRTSRKALVRLAELAAEAAAGIPGARVAIQQLEALDNAADVRQELAALLPGVVPLECEIGAVVAAHTGPGLVAVAVAPAGVPVQ